MDVKRFQYLVDRYEAKMLSDDERGELYDMVSDPVNEDELLDFFQAEAKLTEAVVLKDEAYWKPMLARILEGSRLRQGYVGQGSEKIEEEVEDRSEEIGIRNWELGEDSNESEVPSEVEDSPDDASHVRSDDSDDYQTPSEMLRKGKVIRVWRRIAVAAVVLLLAGAAWMVFSDKKEDVSKSVANQTKFGNDIAPANDAVVLRLEDGSEIILDSTQGIINVKGNEEVVNEDGMLVYSNKAGDEEVVYHTVSTARGNQYQLQLSDGTKVWLNAASSIRFPSVFKGGERKVEITGEAYFEVANAVAPSSSPEGGGTLRRKIPFLVNSAGVVTEVLGTHFNVNSYGDEGGVRVTLLEGSVRVKTDKESKMLEPGEQGEVPRLWIRSGAAPKPLDDGQRGSISVVKNVDVEEVMAWKNGLFYFNDNSIEEVMRQLVRWYDAEVVYEGAKPVKSLSGQISRNVNLSKVLEMMELTGGISFRIEGSKVVVKSK